MRKINLITILQTIFSITTLINKIKRKRKMMMVRRIISWKMLIWMKIGEKDLSFKVILIVKLVLLPLVKE